MYDGYVDLIFYLQKLRWWQDRYNQSIGENMSKYHKLANELAESLLAVTYNEVTKDIIANSEVAQKDIGKLIFNLIFAKSIICIFTVNVGVNFDQELGQKILDPFIDILVANLDKSETANIRIGDYIPHKKELELLKKEYDINENTSTNLYKLYDMIYDIRSREYHDEIIKGVERGKSVSGPLFPLSKCFIRYFTGDDDLEKHSGMFVWVPLILSSYFRGVMHHCSDKLK